jgi:hypothetical protein
LGNNQLSLFLEKLTPWPVRQMKLLFVFSEVSFHIQVIFYNLKSKMFLLNSQQVRHPWCRYRYLRNFSLSVAVLDFLMGDESYLRKRRISVSSRRYKPTGKHRRRFQFLFRDFSLVYRSAVAQIFPRSQPMRESNTSTT